MLKYILPLFKVVVCKQTLRCDNSMSLISKWIKPGANKRKPLYGIQDAKLPAKLV